MNLPNISALILDPLNPAPASWKWTDARIVLHRDTITRAPVAPGQRGFLLPLGTWVKADPACLIVELSTDGGATWTPQAFGVDWAFNVRGWGSWQQPSTADVSSGARLTVAPAPSDLVRLTWLNGSILCAAPEPALARVVGGVLDTNNGPRRYNNANPPNGFILPQRAGLALEFWRWGAHAGSARDAVSLPGYVTQHPGRRFASPYYRLDVATDSGDAVIDPFALPFGAFGGNPRQQRFQFCYYEPTHGACSPFSSVQLRWQRQRNDTNANGVQHPSATIWARA